MRSASVRALGAGLLRDLEALLLPEVCLTCEQPLEPRSRGSVCCTACRWRMRRVPPPVCTRCGQPLDAWERGPADADAARDTSAASACGFCRGWPPELAWAASAVWLEDGPARELAHALKYGGWVCAARPMADILARECRARLAGAELLVPIPLGATRRRERGHNQAADLAAALGAAFGVPMAEAALARSRDTRTQTALTRAERWHNVAGAFAADAAVVRGHRVVVVDDVLTTGATLSACAGELRGAGAARVEAVTLARVVRRS